MRAALNMAWVEDYHHVLLRSGRKDPSVHHFYENYGLEPGFELAKWSGGQVIPEL